MKMLSERKMELEQWVHADGLTERTLMLEKDMQLWHSQLELQGCHWQLTTQLEGLTEEHSLHTLTPTHPACGRRLS